MSPPSTDFPSPVQGLVAQSYDQSTTGPQRRRKKLARERRFAAYARLVMAVAERRRLSEAELRDLMAVQPDAPTGGRLLHELAEAGTIGWPVAWAMLARLWGGGPGGHGDMQLDLPLAANQDGRATP